MQVQVLGCSGGVGAGLRTTALLVDEHVLIDAGTGVGDLPPAAMRGIRHVFLTHSHIDHVYGLPLLFTAVYDEQTEPLIVHALQSTIDALRTHVFNNVLWPDFTQPPGEGRAAIEFEVIEPGDVHAAGGVELEAIAVEHSVPAVGYYCSDGASRFAFSGDTTTNDTFWARLNQLAVPDLLMVETGCPASHANVARVAGHYTPERLAADLAKLEQVPRFAVTHLKPGAEEQTLAELTAALPGRDIQRLRSGDTFTL